MDDTSWYRLATECGGFAVLTFPCPHIPSYISSTEEYTEPKKLPEVYVTFNHEREHDMIDLEEDLKNNSFGFIEVLGGYNPETSKDQEVLYESLLIPYAKFEQLDFGNVRYKKETDSKDGALEFVLKLQSLCRKHHFYNMVVCMPKYFKYEAVSFNTFNVDNPYPVLNGEDDTNPGLSLKEVCRYYRTIVTFNDGSTYGIYMTRGNLEAVAYFDDNNTEIDLFGNPVETLKEQKRREKKEQKETGNGKKKKKNKGCSRQSVGTAFFFAYEFYS